METGRIWCWSLVLLLLLKVVVASTSTNVEITDYVPDASGLKLEARLEEDGLDLGENDRGLSEVSRTTEVSNVEGNAKIVIVGQSHVTNLNGNQSYVTSSSTDQSHVTDPNSGVSYVASPSNDISHVTSSNDGKVWTNDEKSWRSIEPSPEDTYLNALKYSHATDVHERVVNGGSKSEVNKLSRKEYSPGPVYRPEQEYGPPNNGYGYQDKGLASTYGVPVHGVYGQNDDDLNALRAQRPMKFNKQQVPYGSLQNNYSLQGNGYGSSTGPYPQNTYGPPVNPYQPAPYPSHQAYDVPHSISIFPTIDLTWPFALKLNALTLAKILLKLVIFKLIVKFIAVICLLLFIPKLVVKKENDDAEEKRSLGFSNRDLQDFNVLTATVLNSIEQFEKYSKSEEASGNPCTTTLCRVTKALISKESWQDYARLFKSYVAEEQAKEKYHVKTN